MWAGVFINIGILAFFKNWPGFGFPLGLSYVSFQLVSYLLNVNKKRIESKEDLLKLAFHILLFPKISRANYPLWILEGTNRQV